MLTDSSHHQRRGAAILLGKLLPHLINQVDNILPWISLMVDRFFDLVSTQFG